ncbi:MAG: asparaginase [Lachnospiraceae bacterium]|nr:asparaginase [Lachnospiraceae bacterium]
MSKKILIINTGGTLSSVMKENGMAPGLSTDDMLSELRMVSGDADLSFMDFLALDSANILPRDWVSLAKKIGEEQSNYDGIVVIHGTDTLAYTSSMLSFMLSNIAIPVVITGSQLSMKHPVADAMENCRLAIYMACEGYPGVFVAFNRKVILGSRASKVRTLSFDAFESINYPNVAEVSSLGLKVNENVVPDRHGIFKVKSSISEEVGVIKMYPGIKSSVLSSISKAGYKGVYIEAFGLGGMPFRDDDFIGALKGLMDDGVAVLVGTQCRYEGSDLNIYETGKRAKEIGVMQAFDMTTEAAVTKLMWALGQTDDMDEIREYFKVSLCGEVDIEGHER